MQRTNIFSPTKVLSIGFFFLLQNADAAINGWTVPKITGSANGIATVATAFAENLTAGQPTGIKITATSDKSGIVISYSLLSQSVPDMFTINQSSGVITFVKGVLDFETTESFLIRVTASDAAGNGTANVTLKVENAPPVFSPTTYSKEMCDGAKTGTTVTTVKAVDPGNTNVTYALSGTDSSDFAMTDGVINVAPSKTLNMTATKAYVLKVTATDTAKSAPGVGTATVSVSVKVCSGGTSAIAIAYGALLLSICVNRL